MNDNDDASVIKNFHANLRLKCQQRPDDAWTIWNEHTRNREALEYYADCMHRLATEKWARRETEEPDRVHWIMEHLSLFHVKRDRERISKRLSKKLKSLGSEPDFTLNPTEPPFQVLDVGSCFAPFSKYPDIFDALSLDIAPAGENVLQCDFLNVKVGDRLSFTQREVTELPKKHFDAVIFCLLLEYLPLPRMRHLACQKARDLLKDNGGVLFIVTPDSSHQGKNLSVIRSWRICLALMGFIRIYYEKLEHVHCMAFLKVNSCELSLSEARNEAAKMNFQIESMESEEDLMIIPQDSVTAKIIDKSAKTKGPEVFDAEETSSAFEMLPFAN